MSSKPIVFVVDDDQHICDALRLFLNAVNIRVETFINAMDFLKSYTPDQPGCLILDVRMPGISGLELQRHLKEQGFCLPIIFITGYGDVCTAIRAMKAGALDFIEKPFSNQILLHRVQEALSLNAQFHRKKVRYDAIAARMELLSPREKDVLEQMMAGQHSKSIASRLGVSVSSVDVYRRRIREKLQARSLSELVYMLNLYKHRTINERTMN